MGVLSSPSNQLLGVWAEVAKLLTSAECFNEDVSDVRLEREALLKLLELNLFVDNGLARGLRNDGGDFLPAIQCFGSAERLATISIGLGENSANELTRISDSVDIGYLGLRGVVAGKEPGSSTIESPSWSSKGIRLETFHKEPR